MEGLTLRRGDDDEATTLPALHQQQHFRLGPGRLEHREEVLAALDRLAVHLQDHVSRSEPPAERGTPRLDRRDQHPALFHLEFFSQFGGEMLNRKTMRLEAL